MKTLCRKDRTGSKKRNTKQRALLVEKKKRIRSIIDCLKEKSVEFCVARTQRQQQRGEKTRQVTVVVFIRTNQERSNQFDLGSVVLLRRGNTSLCVGDCVISIPRSNTQRVIKCSVVFRYLHVEFIRQTAVTRKAK